MPELFHMLFRLWRQMRSQWGWMVLAAWLGLLTMISGIGLVMLSAYLLSEAALHPPLMAIAVAIVGVRFFAIIRGIFRYLERLISHHVTFRLLTQFRMWFYRSLEPLVPARLMTLMHECAASLTSGDLFSRLVADVETLQECYVRVFSPPLVALIIGVLMWFVLGAYNVFLALTFVAFYVLAGIGIPLLSSLLSHRAGQEVVALKAALHMDLMDSLQGCADLLACGREEEQMQKVATTNRNFLYAQAALSRIRGLQNALHLLLTDGCTWAMLLVAIPLVRSGQLNGVYLALLVLAALGSFEAIQPLALAAHHLGSTSAAARRLFEVIDTPPAIIEREDPSPVPCSYDLEVRHLSFRYTPQSPLVLRDINFSLPQGQCLAIVGPSGAGKSTLAHLLLRLWDYDHGTILLGGHDLRAYRQQDIHHLFSVVEQHPHLFNATIRENLLLGRSDASMDEVIQAAQQAHLHEFIQTLPQGYETPIGQEGLKLSGGERQRLALARAFLKNAPLLLLDEPTAHLDAVTVQQVMCDLQKFRQGRTMVIITHHLTKLTMADHILVLDTGESCGRIM